jgi:hypothetical protein
VPESEVPLLVEPLLVRWLCAVRIDPLLDVPRVVPLAEVKALLLPDIPLLMPLPALPLFATLLPAMEPPEPDMLPLPDIPAFEEDVAADPDPEPDIDVPEVMLEPVCACALVLITKGSTMSAAAAISTVERRIVISLGC